MNEALTHEQANRVYDILVAHAGEVEGSHSRNDFVYHQTSGFCSEYRFMGGLGFGGKFWRRGAIGYVNAYVENEAFPGIRAMIDATNQALDKLAEEYA